jgi:hypothetical protein
MDMDVRWKQRLQNFKKAFIVLEKAVKLAGTRNEIITQIINNYFSHFQKLLNKMEGINTDEIRITGANSKDS